MFFIHKKEVPQDSNVTYTCIVCDIIHQNKETYIVRLTVGGKKIYHNGPLSTPTSYLTTSKLHWNSVLSTLDGKYLIVDFKNFYLKKPMKEAKYYKISIKLIPQEIIDKYDLKNKQIYGYIYIRAEREYMA